MGPAGRTTPAATVACPSCGTRNRLPAPGVRGTPRCGRCRTVLPWIVEASEETFDAELDVAVPVIVDFWAPWCGPCRMIAPVLEQLAADRAGRLKVVKVNVDHAHDLAARYGAMSIPLLVIFKEGWEADRVLGAVPQRELEARLDRLAGT